ncbi:MAG TPA: radical SAM protein [Puia sp.]|nr:radical SAM protein [Puia sp.]
MTAETIGDRYGRNFKTLRVSLLSSCNLGCVYCIAGDGQGKELKRTVTKAQLSAGALLQLIDRLHDRLKLNTIRLTGGEPLLYKGLVEVIAGIRSIGIADIKLTTNGLLLEKLAVPMKRAGMSSINVSLDAVDEDVFFLMSKRKSADRIIRGIDAALQAGLDVKINTVVVKGMNESQVLPLLEFAFSRNIRIRFLELMAMGYLHEGGRDQLFRQDQILSLIAAHYPFTPLPRSGSATANYWQTDAGGIFGIIANESEPFCGDCNRLRLDSQGNIYGCLSSNHPIPLNMTDSATEWSGKLQLALLQKQELRFTGSDLSMLHIGG